VCGKGSNHCTEGDGFLAPNDSLHEVRCCSDVSLPDWMESRTDDCNVWILSEFEDGTCYENKSYCEAQNICISAGGRLCTKAELEGKCTEGSGCGFDYDLIWSDDGGFLDSFPCASACDFPPKSPPRAPSAPTPLPSAPTSLPTREPNAHNVVCGKGSNHCTEGDGFLAPNDALHEVRCCSDVSLPSWTKSTICDIWVESLFDGNQCQENKSYCEAHKICADTGGRLCTKVELEAKCTMDTGCEFDNDLIWSQTEGFLDGSPSTPACVLS